MSAPQITDAERKTLDRAADILTRITPPNASWFIDIRTTHGARIDVTYFTTRKEQTPSVRGKTFADKVQEVLCIQHREDSDEDGARARRVAKLQEEIAALTGEPA